MTVTKTIWFDNYTTSREAFQAMFEALVPTAVGQQKVFRSHGMESIAFNVGTHEEFKLNFRTRTEKSGPS